MILGREKEIEERWTRKARWMERMERCISEERGSSQERESDDGKGNAERGKEGRCEGRGREGTGLEMFLKGER